MEESQEISLSEQKVSKSGSDSGTINFKKSTIWKIATFIFAVLFILSFFGYIGSNSKPTPGTNNNMKVDIKADGAILGDENAPVKIVEFSDFQCPFCARAFFGALAEFKKSDYFKNGEVALVFKHFPLTTIHPYAQKAAEAAECAGDQDKFWEYHDLLFENQQALAIDDLKKYAGQLGLDQVRFDNCLDEGQKTGKVNSDAQQAQAAGGRGTPYFVLINEDGETQVISGAQPWVNFESAIQVLL